MNIPEQKSDAQQIIEATRIGYDEMNLVEYPFASLWTKEQAGGVIEHHWETQHPVTGRTVKASWRVTGDPELGLPGPSDERVYLALMELSRQAGFCEPVVRFTRHDLLKRLGWTHNDKNYRLLVNSFRRLGAAFISGENAFWDASIKSFRTIGFNILDHYDIVAEKPGRKKKNSEGQIELPLSYFKWADVIFASVQAGYIRTLDVGFALSLKGDLALRLFRYLDKKAYDGRRSFEIELSTLCERHLGMKPTRYDSTRKTRLKSAHDELLARGFLREVTFAPMKTRKAEKACYAFAMRRAAGDGAALDEPPAEPLLEPHLSSLVPLPAPGRTLAQAAPEKLRTSAAPPEIQPELPEQEPELLLRMTRVGVSPEVARGFMAEESHQQLELQLDCLPERRAKDPAAVFVKSVREKWGVPQAHLDRVEARQREEQAQASQQSARASKARQEAARREQNAVQEQENIRLDALWEQMDDATRQGIEREAVRRLGVLGRSGRAKAALIAMRRNLMREKQGS